MKPPTSISPQALAAPEPPAPAAGRGRVWRAFDALYKKYVPFVRRLLTRRNLVPASVDDLVQKIFFTLSRRMTAGDSIRNPEAMLVTILGHEVANHGRIAKPDVEPGADVAEVPCAAPDPERSAELAERRAAIQAHLDAMEPAAAELIVYADLLEMTYAQIAANRGQPESTVAYQVQRARADLEARIRGAASGKGGRGGG